MVKYSIYAFGKSAFVCTESILGSDTILTGKFENGKKEFVFIKSSKDIKI